MPFEQTTYQPMRELLEFVRAHGFHVFVVTGGGVEFVRAVGEVLYGVGPDDVVGSAVQVAFERRDGRAVLVRQAAMLGSPNEGAPKAVNIQTHIGRRPILAVGNSAGDREMLEYVHSGSGPSLCVVIDHDDAEREYAYDERGGHRSRRRADPRHRGALRLDRRQHAQRLEPGLRVTATRRRETWIPAATFRMGSDAPSRRGRPGPRPSPSTASGSTRTR